MSRPSLGDAYDIEALSIDDLEVLSAQVDVLERIDSLGANLTRQIAYVLRFGADKQGSPPLPKVIEYCDTLKRIEGQAATLAGLCKEIEPILREGVHRRTAAINETAAKEREAKRSERIAARPVTATVEMGRKCSVCNKKPARIDDLCKICARKSGIIVHGKIGTP